MTKTSLEMKKLVEEFIKITNVKYEDQTDKIKEKSDLIDWQFHVGTNVISVRMQIEKTEYMLMST